MPLLLDPFADFQFSSTRGADLARPRYEFRFVVVKLRPNVDDLAASDHAEFTPGGVAWEADVQCYLSGEFALRRNRVDKQAALHVHIADERGREQGTDRCA